MSEVTADARPSMGKGFRLQWEPAQNAHVLLYPEGMVKLNQSAAAIMSRCDGRRTIAEIVSDLETTYSTTGLEKDVVAFVSMALQRSWLDVGR